MDTFINRENSTGIYHIFILVDCKWYKGRNDDVVFPALSMGLQPGNSQTSTKDRITRLIKNSPYLPAHLFYMPVQQYSVYVKTTKEESERDNQTYWLLLFPVDMNPMVDLSSKLTILPEELMFTYKVNQPLNIKFVNESGIPIPDVLALDALIRYEFNYLVEEFDTLTMQCISKYENSEDFANKVNKVITVPPNKQESKKSVINNISTSEKKPSKIIQIADYFQNQKD